MSRGVEEDLRAVLAARAAAVEPGREPHADTTRAIRRDRWRRVLTVGLAACLIVAVAAPVAVLRPFSDAPFRAWGVRGSLAGDASFLDAVRQEAAECAQDNALRAPGPDSLRAPDPDSRSYGLATEASRVLYAGDVGAYRVVVAAVPRAEHPEQGLLLMLAWEAGAPPGLLTCHFAGGYESGTPPLVSWMRGSPEGGSTLFVLGPPDVRKLEYSRHPSFLPDGTWRRSWRELPARDGVAFVTLPGPGNPDRGAPHRVRASLPAGTQWIRPSFSHFGLPDLPAVTVPGSEDAEPGPTDLRARRTPSPLGSAASMLATLTGIPERELELRMLWREGTGESRGRGPGSALIAATTPNGATLQVARLGTGVSVRPVAPGQQVDAPVAALRWSVRPREGDVDTRGGARFFASLAVLALDYPGARVELWRAGTRIASKRLDSSGETEFREPRLPEPSSTDDRWWFRIVDEEGRELYRGPVGTGGAPWNRVRGDAEWLERFGGERR